MVNSGLKRFILAVDLNHAPEGSKVKVGLEEAKIYGVAGNELNWSIIRFLDASWDILFMSCVKVIIHNFRFRPSNLLSQVCLDSLKIHSLAFSIIQQPRLVQLDTVSTW